MAKGDFTKAKEISEATKKIVLERQGNKSISGVNLYNKSVNFHHYVERSSSGVGYSWNVCALTAEEHRQLHDKVNIKVNGHDYYTWQEFETIIHNHLLLSYKNWSIEKCRYHKGYEEGDYGVILRNSRHL